jgi:hypothetical protein
MKAANFSRRARWHLLTCARPVLVLIPQRSQEANASLQGRLEMLGWRQRAAARRAERQRRRAERQRKLQEWLAKKNLEEIARKAAYASSIRRQLGDLDVWGAGKSVEKSRKFVDAVLKDIDTENYGFWRSKSARAMFFQVGLIWLAGLGR